MSARPPDPAETQGGLRVEGLAREGVFQDVAFRVRPGEVVALAGLVGSGRSEVVRAVFGLDPRGGRVWANGRAVGSVRDAIAAGVALVPEDRQHEGLVLPMSIEDNLGLVARSGQPLLRRSSDERERTRQARERLDIRMASASDPVASLSGGNQQKVLLGKWLAGEPTILLLDEPTRGVDVGAKAQIHRRIRELADSGAAVLVVSSEIPEVLALADRVLVMREGRIAGELDRASASPEAILGLALPDGAAQDQRTTPWRASRTTIGWALLALLAACSLANPAFASLDNLRDLLVKTAPALIVGSALTLVVLAREIDISVGSLMGLCAAVMGIATSADRMGLPPWVGVAACLGVGVLGGLLNGAIVAWGRVPSIIATLGTLTVFRGVTELLLGGRWIERMPEGLRAFGTGGLGGVPYSVMAALVFALAMGVLAHRTPFGLRVRALGSAPRSAEVVGVPGARLRWMLFALTGLACGVAALFSATQLRVVESGFGSGFELVAVASVIVGGTSIQGGRGTVLGTVFAAWLLGSLSTVLIFLRLGEAATYWERMAQGVLILAAVLLDRSRRVS